MKALSTTLDHDVYIYESGKFPAAPIANFLFDGVVQGENAAVIASAHHASLIETDLAKLAVRTGVPSSTVFVDVSGPTRALLAGHPVSNVLGRIIAPTLQQARETSLSGRIRFYGELGEMMLRLHNPEIARELERLGGQFAADGMTKIWCGYCADTFPDASHAKDFTRTCLLHRHLFTGIEDRADWRCRVAEGIQERSGLV